MKAPAPAILGLVAWTCAAARHADAEQWRYAWDLDNTAAPSGFVRIDLTPAFVDRSAPSLADARILPTDMAGRPWNEARQAQVPYMISNPPTGSTTIEEWKPLQVMNRVFEPEQYEQIVLDFGDPRMKNQVKIDLSGDNFRRRAAIEGSEDGRDWKMIRDDAWLFDISQPHGNYRVDTVDFPINNFRYLRVTVFHMADDPRRIEIESVRTLHRDSLTVEPVAVDIAAREDAFDETARASEIRLDLGYRNLPVSRIRIATEAPFFYRAYELSGRNEAVARVERRTETGWDVTERDVPWSPIERGVIYRTHEGDARDERLSIECVAPYRYLRLRIYHEDNPPIDVTGVQVYRRALPALVFANDPATPLTIMSGAPSAMAPSYDLARSIRDLDIDALPEVELPSTPRDIGEAAQVPWTARNAWVIWLALIPAVLIMGGLIWANLAKMKQDTPN